MTKIGTRIPYANQSRASRSNAGFEQKKIRSRTGRRRFVERWEKVEGNSRETGCTFWKHGLAKEGQKGVRRRLRPECSKKKENVGAE